MLEMWLGIDPCCICCEFYDFSYSFCYYKTQLIRKKDINCWRNQNFQEENTELRPLTGWVKYSL